MEVRGKGKKVPWLGGPGGPLGIKALISSWIVRAFSESLPLSADASRTYRPNPQATTKPAPGPPSLKGYEGKGYFP